ncbi:MAG: adenosylcobinamide-GDP ribazoletransferase [Anaerolineae bacterium]|jgi:adenosylcobinamide-GDP ribazoletransferase|nr:adenosylcobinamide-GDP ribazoletransferase [Anaerolineae bacterium]MBT7325081.1 adenosylcobinamide-GDP ribazoletransferase [Anaerolineae bacterium]
MISLIAAFQFLTIIPPIIRRPFTAEEMARGVGWFPLVGLALGGIFYGLDSSLRLLFPLPVVAIFTLAAWLLLTRALHFDGFLDICDGLFGGFTPERRLEIMRDSRVGAFGVAGGGMLLLAKYTAIISLSDRSGLLLAPLIGRWVLAMGIYLFPYARQKGLGRDMKNNVHWTQILLATAITLIAAWLIAAWMGLIALLLAGLTLWLGATFIIRRIPGLTGDAYGALAEMVELVVLLFFTM